eukprot:CCRYP_020874-RA/>CCRYP_020874-RA protein AED:0.58 eAED:0.39 QI:0/0/0/1/0/0/3/0/174
MFSFDRTPMAPIGTEVMVHAKPNRRQTWGYHAIRKHGTLHQPDITTVASQVTESQKPPNTSYTPLRDITAIQNLHDLITGAASSLNNTPPSTEPISTIIKETATSITPTLTNLVSPNPSPQPLQSATPTRVPNQPTVIPFEEHQYTPSDPPTPRYNLRSQSNIALSAIAMIGEA